MSKKRTLVSKAKSFLYNHVWLKRITDYLVMFFMSVLSAAVFAVGLICFLKPAGQIELVSGGSTGVSQVISLIFSLFNVKPKNSNLIFTIAYLCINLPLVALAFFGIGKRFGVFTLVNVACVSLFSNLFAAEPCLAFFSNIATFVNNYGGLLARALFAGLCTGMSSAIAFKFETSAGGFDIISFFLSLRKSTTAGKYGVIINAVVVASFCLLTGISGEVTKIGEVEYSSWTLGFSGIFFSVIYLFTVMLVIDAINVRNKKVQLQIISKDENLIKVLLANVPHGATVVDAKGAFSNAPKKIIYMVISTIELKQVINVIHQIDPEAFVNVMHLQQVYGRFYMKPIK